MNINYAQCWEDAGVLRRALVVGPGDDVLSIASGGDNSFALLLDNPRSVVAIDRNPAQIYLIELKIAALRTLDYDDFVAFLGAASCRNRPLLYKAVRTRLSPPAARFWDAHSVDIANGVLHCGKFERYLASFRRFVLPLVQSQRTVREFLASQSLAEQARHYHASFDSARWRFLFKTVFSRPMLSRFGRCRGAFSQIGRADIASELLRRTEHGLTGIPVLGNYFIRYALAGRYDLERCAPTYLQARNFYRLRERIDRLRLLQGDLFAHINDNSAQTYSAFNLSDVFEYMNTDQVTAFTQSLCRISRENSRMAFWTMFKSQEVPADSRDRVTHARALSDSLRHRDIGFFYGSFNLWRIIGAVEHRTSSGSLDIAQEAQL